jgi:pimeloyl-ACP methyl ester carboxylesterase
MNDEPRLKTIALPSARGGVQMAYWEWGDPDNPRVLVCVHGLARQGRDFDVLAGDLREAYRVVCPDVVGRGRSGWLAEPMGYTVPGYVGDMLALLGTLRAAAVDWVGTSMGGLIGLGVASVGPMPIRRLVLNDVGPTIEAAALQRIGTYLGAPARWASLDEAADALWQISQGFGPHTREQWLALTRPQLKDDGVGGFVPHYDPAIAVPFRAVTPELAAAGEAALWQAWDRLRCEALLLRGALSDLLARATAEAMTQRGPRARLHEFDGVGHAPMLVQPEQRAVVREFLLAP